MGDITDAIPLTDVLALLSQAFQTIQISSFGLDMEFRWPADMIQNLKRLAYFRLDFLDVKNLWFIMFWVVVGGLLLYCILTVVFVMLEVDLCEGPVDEIIWYYLGESVLFGILFIPFMRILLEAFKCENINGEYVVKFWQPDPPIACGAGLHWLLIGFSVLTLIVLIAGGIFKAAIANTLDHEESAFLRMRGSVTYFRTKHQVYRLLMIVVSLFVPGVICPIIMFLLTTLWFGYSLYACPYLKRRHNLLFLSMYGIPVWIMLSAMITEGVNSSAGAYSLIGLIFWAAIVIVASFFRIKQHPPTEEDASVVPSGLAKATTMADKFAEKHGLSSETSIEIMVEDDNDLKSFLSKSYNHLQTLVVKGKTAFHSREEDNVLSPNSVCSLSFVIGQNPSLVVFSFTKLILDMDRAMPMMNALKMCPLLETVDLFDNKLDLDTSRFIIQTLAENRNIRRINMGSNQYTDRVKDSLQNMTENDSRYRKIQFDFSG